jgi:hypothetical protein
METRRTPGVSRAHKEVRHMSPSPTWFRPRLSLPLRTHIGRQRASGPQETYGMQGASSWGWGL